MALSDQVYEHLLKMNKQALLNLMLESIEEMQSYNGRSITECVMIAMDAKYVPEKTAWEVPTVYKLNKNWKENFPLEIE